MKASNWFGPGQMKLAKYSTLSLDYTWLNTDAGVSARCEQGVFNYALPGLGELSATAADSCTVGRNRVFYYTARIIKLLALWLDFILLTLLLYGLSWLPERLRGQWYFGLYRVWCRSFVRALDVNLRMHQKNLQDIPTQYILIANHPSALEDIGIPALFEVYSLAKIEVRDWWIAGRISTAAGNLYVRRESRESRQQAATELKQAVLAGKNIALYPEGGCKGKRIFESFRYGAFDVSMQTGVPILPVFLHYEAQDDFAWRSPHTLLDKIYHFLNTQNNSVNYYVFDAIDPAGFNSKEEYTEYVWQLYRHWQTRYLE